jgi:hypothetical protein
MLCQDTDIRRVLRLVRAEYVEIPALNLTKPQVQRLWGLDPDTCDAVLRRLEEDKFLRRTSGDAYVRADLDR